MSKTKTLRLILGDQLNSHHSWFEKKDPAVTHVMMEMRQETDYVHHHIQKVAAFFAAMRQFAAELKSAGHRVVYLKLDDPANRQNLEDNLADLVNKHKFNRFEYMLPDEHRLDSQLEKVSGGLGVSFEAVDSEHFLTDRNGVRDFFSGKKQYLMESFYRMMRKKYDILMDDGKPAGGRWNYDQKNRSRYDGKVELPPSPRHDNDVSRITAMIDRAGVSTFGAIDPKRLAWPVSRRQALEALETFLKNRLAHFGTYQDAMTEKSWTLFHSCLSFALNTKMLLPMEVIRAVVEHARKSRKRISIEQVEGFVRQVLGWREYMRGIYWALMPEYAGKNFFDHQKRLPQYYWSGRTEMNCMRHAIGQSLEHAYAHHIQRLMITGNFALLAGIDPDEVDRWYLGVYIDAVEWVEMPNTRGMSQFADGGIVATKPYISSANYIKKMSDYCGACPYDAARKTGDRACPFNSLYWDFLDRHRKRLQNNPRVAMMYRTWDRMQAADRNDLLEQAARCHKNLEKL